MSFELEAKIKVDDHAPVRSKLAEVDADCLGRVLETNHIYDSPDRTLLSAGRGIRIRTHHAEQGDPKPSTLTYKGKLKPGPMKHRREIEVELDDGGSGRAILDRLGYIEVICFEKWRESWQMGECLVELDELPHLGCYIEVEGPAHEQIEAVLASLGLADRPLIHQSYVKLLKDHCQAASLPASKIRF